MVNEVVQLVVTEMGAQLLESGAPLGVVDGGTLDPQGDLATPSSTTMTCGGEVSTAGRDGRFEGGHQESWAVQEETGDGNDNHR